MHEYLLTVTAMAQKSDTVKFLSFSQRPFLGVAYTVDSLVCILVGLSRNVYKCTQTHKHTHTPCRMGVLFGGVFSLIFFF